MKTAICFIALTTSFSNLQASGFNSSAIGTTGASFFNFGAGARAIAMGGANSAAADDAASVYWNPAGLVYAPQFSMMLMHSQYLAGITLDHAAFAINNGNGSAFAASIGYMNGGKADRTDITGADLGSYSPKDYSGSLAYAVAFADGDLALGVNAKFLKSTIIESANAWAFDAGVITKHDVLSGLKLAAVAQNLGPDIKFDKAGSPLPLSIKLGAALNISDKFLMTTDIIAPRSNAPYGAIGAEVKSEISDETAVALRGGFNTLNMTSLGGMSGLSAGAGISFTYFTVDYAFVPFGDLGLTHRLSMSLKFGSSAGTPKHYSGKSHGLKKFKY